MFVPSRFGAGSLALAGACAALGCGDEDTRQLPPAAVALADTVPPSYDDGELTIYEAKTSLLLPIIAPGDVAMSELAAVPSDPFERLPWVTNDDVGVQVSWTLSNLDEQEHGVWVMLDPHNEFGRYEPAIVIRGNEATRDLSGIDMLFLLPGTGSGQAGSRIVGTFTFDDMDELARDFAAVFKILRDAAPSDELEEDPRSTLVNYAFNVRNRSYDSPLLDPYRPLVVPGLTGFDFGVRTFEPANVALEVVVEVRDQRGDRVAERGQAVRLLEPAGAVISAGAP